MNFTEKLELLRYQLTEKALNTDSRAVTFLCCLAVLGITGNAILLDVSLHTKKKVLSTYFIIGLAAIDLSISLIIIPFRAILHYVNVQPPICGVYLSFAYGTVSISVYFFICIAFDRYQSVCMLNKQVLKKNHIKYIAVLAVFSGIYSSVIAHLYLEGMVTIENGAQSVTLYMRDHFPCYVNGMLSLPNRAWDPRYIVHFIYAVIHLLVILFVIVLYSFMFKTLRQTGKFRLISKSVVTPSASVRQREITMPSRADKTYLEESHMADVSGPGELHKDCDAQIQELTLNNRNSAMATTGIRPRSLGKEFTKNLPKDNSNETSQSAFCEGGVPEADSLFHKGENMMENHKVSSTTESCVCTLAKGCHETNNLADALSYPLKRSDKIKTTLSSQQMQRHKRENSSSVIMTAYRKHWESSLNSDNSAEADKGHLRQENNSLESKQLNDSLIGHVAGEPSGNISENHETTIQTMSAKQWFTSSAGSSFKPNNYEDGCNKLSEHSPFHEPSTRKSISHCVNPADLLTHLPLQVNESDRQEIQTEILPRTCRHSAELHRTQTKGNENATSLEKENFSVEQATGKNSVVSRSGRSGVLINNIQMKHSSFCKKDQNLFPNADVSEQMVNPDTAFDHQQPIFTITAHDSECETSAAARNRMASIHIPFSEKVRGSGYVNLRHTSHKSVTEVLGSQPSSSKKTRTLYRGITCRFRLTMSTKISLRLFLVTLIYCFLWIPLYLIELGVIKHHGVLLQMFFVGNVINPIIHFMTSHVFRQEAAYRLKRILIKKNKDTH